MYFNSRRVECDTCDHKGWCEYSELYREACQKVAGSSERNSTTDGEHRICALAAMNFIKIIGITCRYYSGPTCSAEDIL